MCFSAPASFAASGGLAIMGGATLHTADKKHKLLAVIPFAFAIQQAFEGYQWLAICSGNVSNVAAYGFIFFALLFWPFYVPVVVFALDRSRRGVLRWVVVVGISLSLYYLFYLLSKPLNVSVLNKSINYSLSTPFAMIPAAMYFIATCGAFLLSSKRAYQWFGLLLVLSAVFAKIFFLATFTSVWCFFAAILSSLIYFYLRNLKKHHE